MRRIVTSDLRVRFAQAVKYLTANGTEKAWNACNDRQGPFVKVALSLAPAGG